MSKINLKELIADHPYMKDDFGAFVTGNSVVFQQKRRFKIYVSEGQVLFAPDSGMVFYPYQLAKLAQFCEAWQEKINLTFTK